MLSHRTSRKKYAARMFTMTAQPGRVRIAQLIYQHGPLTEGEILPRLPADLRHAANTRRTLKGMVALAQLSEREGRFHLSEALHEHFAVHGLEQPVADQETVTRKKKETRSPGRVADGRSDDDLDDLDDLDDMSGMSDAQAAQRKRDAPPGELVAPRQAWPFKPLSARHIPSACGTRPGLEAREFHPVTLASNVPVGSLSWDKWNPRDK